MMAELDHSREVLILTKSLLEVLKRFIRFVAIVPEVSPICTWDLQISAVRVVAHVAAANWLVSELHHSCCTHC